MTRESEQPPPERRNSALAQKMQAQLSNLTYRKSNSKTSSGSPSSAEFDLGFEVSLEGQTPLHVQLRITKNMRADEVLRHILHQLSGSTGYQRHAADKYFLSEVVYDDMGQICKERRLNYDDHPAQLQLLWPRDQV